MRRVEEEGNNQPEFQRSRRGKAFKGKLTSIKNWIIITISVYNLNAINQ